MAEDYFEKADESGGRPLRIALFSRYERLGASSRMRTFQYLPFLESRGISVQVKSFLDDEYVRSLYRGKVSYARVFQAYGRRLSQLLTMSRFDLMWVEKEALPWFPYVLEWFFLPHRIPIVVDYDDAVFHFYDGHRNPLVRAFLSSKIDQIMRCANVVVVGNQYLKERAVAVGARRIEILPTVVSIKKYEVSLTDRPYVTVGWIGSPSTARYLHMVGPVLKKLVDEKILRVVAVGPNAEQLAGLPIEVKPWTEEDEVSEIQKFDIGIMPLPDNPPERGKCGYKLIQYMACGLPVVASPVGANKSIVRDGIDGFHASNSVEWEQSLRMLCSSSAIRRRLGAAGRQRVEAMYSLEVTQERLEGILRSTALNHKAS